jgi:hypothetical protein
VAYGPSFDTAKAQIKDALGLPQRLQALRTPPPQQQMPLPRVNPRTYNVPAGAPGLIGAQQPQPMASRFGGAQVGMQGQSGGVNINLGPSGQFQGANANMPLGNGQFDVGAALDNSAKLQDMQARYSQGPFSATANYSPSQGVGGGVQYQSGPFSASGGYNQQQGAYGNVGMRVPFQEGGLASSIPGAMESYQADVNFINNRDEQMHEVAGKTMHLRDGGGVWTRKEGQNPEGGLNAKGRASLKAQGHDIKPPVSAKQAKKSPKAAARRSSFCARSAGQAKQFPEAARDPNSRLNKARRKWDC